MLSKQIGDLKQILEVCI